MMQAKDVEGKAEQQPFSGDLRIAAKQKTPEIKILLYIRKVAFGLNGTCLLYTSFDGDPTLPG